MRRHTRNKNLIDIRYLDANLKERVITVRTTWQLDDTLTDLYEHQCKPISINAEPAYNPADVQKAVRYLEAMGCEVNRCSLFEYQVFVPQASRFYKVSPLKLIDEALKVRKAQLEYEAKLQEAGSGDSDSK